MQGVDRPFVNQSCNKMAIWAEFPTITIKDMVKAQKHLIDHLGIEKLLCVVGGSMVECRRFNGLHRILRGYVLSFPSLRH